MQKLFTFLVCSMLLTSVSNAQPSVSPDELVSGQITLPDNSSVSGSIKDNIRKKGELVITANGKKTKYKAGDITAVTLGSTQYITWNYTFYEVLWQGQNFTILRKANEPAGVQFSGAEAVSVSSEGDIDDLFVRKKGDATLHLVTKKNVKDVLNKICTTCTSAVDDEFNKDALRKALEQCEKCK